MIVLKAVIGATWRVENALFQVWRCVTGKGRTELQRFLLMAGTFLVTMNQVVLSSVRDGNGIKDWLLPLLMLVIYMCWTAWFLLVPMKAYVQCSVTILRFIAVLPSLCLVLVLSGVVFDFLTARRSWTCYLGLVGVGTSSMGVLTGFRGIVERIRSRVRQ